MAKLRWHQLFFAHMQRPRKAARRPQAERPRQYPQRLPALELPKPAPIQLPLFHAVRDYTLINLPERIDRRYFHHLSDNPTLNWARHAAREIAELRGWPDWAVKEVDPCLVIALIEHVDGERISYRQLHAALRPRRGPLQRTAQILDRIGLLDDDRPATFDQWLAHKLTDLAPGIRSEVQAWLQNLHNGGPRARPRAASTAQEYFNAIQDSLLRWSRRYAHLREVTRDDILAATDQLLGNDRLRALRSLRSLFKHAKATGQIFRDPTSRIWASPRSVETSLLRRSDGKDVSEVR